MDKKKTPHGDALAVFCFEKEKIEKTEDCDKLIDDQR